MTAAPGPTTYLALVICHPSSDMVVATGRDGPNTHCRVTSGTAHLLDHSGLPRTAGLLHLCAKKEKNVTKASLSMYDRNAINMGQLPCINERHLRFGCTRPDARRWCFSMHHQRQVRLHRTTKESGPKGKGYQGTCTRYP